MMVMGEGSGPTSFWLGHQSLGASGYWWGATPWGQHALGGWHGWACPGWSACPGWLCLVGLDPFLNWLVMVWFHLGFCLWPLGDHLTTTMWDKILKGGYMDSPPPLLFCDLEKNDKDDLGDHLKECIKCHMIVRMYASWYPGFLIYAGVVHYQPWRALLMLQTLFTRYL